MSQLLLIEDFSRVQAASVPRDPKKYSKWADYACVEWPPSLTILAAIIERDGYRDEDFARFLDAYSAWLALSEPQKELPMIEDQIHSMKRRWCMKIASDAARTF